jgi:hypothetical protein
MAKKPIRIEETFTVNNQTTKKITEVPYDNPVGSEPVALIPARAKAGTLTTRTDANTGTLTMAGGHGITDGLKVDLMWTNADGTKGFRYNMTVGTVATNSVPIDLGGGDSLPVTTTAIIVIPTPTEEVFVIVGDNMVALELWSEVEAVVSFIDGSAAGLAGFHLKPPTSGNEGGTYHWWTGNGVTNPLAGVTTAKVRFSHVDGTTARGMSAYGFFN